MTAGQETPGRQPPAALAIIGFMGTGKSSVGRAVAARLGLQFVDTDKLIEARHGSIAEIFAAHGEQAFRRVEREEVCAAIAKAHATPCVLALGGGAVLSGDVREALESLPHVVWLTAPADVLWKRVQSGGASLRPLAADERRFRRLFDERAALYASVSTDQVVNDGRRPLARVAAEVAAVALPSGTADAAPQRADNHSGAATQ